MLLYKCWRSKSVSYGVYRRFSQQRLLSSNSFSSSVLKFRSCACECVPVTATPTISARFFSNDDSNKPRKLHLMNFDQRILPSFIKTIKNWIFSMFIIRPYFDKDFSLPEFVNGAKHAVQIVSKHLSLGEYKELDGLVSGTCLNEVKSSITALNMSQRQELAINKEDIYFCFPYEVGVMFDESSESSEQKRSVEITMVFHILRGLQEMTDRGEPPPLNMGINPEYKDKIIICNYRFIRDYTKGVSDQWTVNIINHFKPAEQVEAA